MEDLPNNYNVAVGVTNVLVAQECYQERVSITITNTSTGGQKISIGDGQEAVVGNGIVLSPGGVYNDSADGGYRPSRAQINAISNLAGGTLAVKERIKSSVRY